MKDFGTSFAQKNVLITGGAGFIGSSLAHRLVNLGAHVTVLDAMLPLYGGNMFNLESIKDSITFVVGDIRDEALVESLVTGKDFIFNFAAQVSHLDSKEQPFLDLDINGKGHLTVLEAVRKCAPQAKVFFPSSRLVYGKIHTNPVDETHPTNPVSPYGIHKVLGEKYYRYYSDIFGLHTVIVRIPNPYGPRQLLKHNKYSVVGWFVKQALNDETITIFGDGLQERDYIYIDDVVEAFLHLALSGKSGEIYNIGTSEKVRFVDLIDSILEEAQSGKKSHIEWPAHYPKNETDHYVANYKKIQEHTTWQPQVALKDGIKRMVEYYKKHKDKYVQ